MHFYREQFTEYLKEHTLFCYKMINVQTRRLKKKTMKIDLNVIEKKYHALKNALSKQR